MSDSGMYILANLIKIGQEEIILNGSKALSLSSNSISTDSGIKFSIPSDKGLSFNGKGINTQNKNKSNQNLTVFPNKNNIGKNKDITVSIPDSSNVSGILPDPPTNIFAERQGSTQIKVTFTPPEFTGGSPITSYTAVVSYDDKKTTSSNTSPQTGTSTVSPINVDGLTLGNTYKLKVYATNSTGNSDLSVESNSVLNATVPDALQSLTATAGPGAGEITLNWSAPDNGGASIDKYNIYYTQGGVAKTKETTETSYIAKDLGNATSYVFTVKAENVVGEGSGKESSSVKTFSVPDALQSVTSTAGPNPGEITLSWSAPANGGASIDKYNIYYTQGGVAKTKETTETSYIAKDLGNATSYVFTVKAENVVGEGSGKESSSVKTFSVPDALQSVATTTGPGLGEITLSWSAPANGGSSIDKYNIYYTQGGVAKTKETTETSYIAKDLGNGTSYVFTVKAENAVGEGSGKESSSVKTFSVPDAPTSVSASTGPGVGEITLSWSAPANGGASISEYNIYRGATYVDKTTLTSYIAKYLENGTSYVFTVKAVNVVGEGSGKESSSVKTFGVPGTVDNFQIFGLSGGGIKCTWNDPIDTGGVQSSDISYKIYINNVVEPYTFSTSFNTSNYVIQYGRYGNNNSYYRYNLLNYTTYNITIEPVNIIGPGTKVTKSASPDPFSRYD